MRSIHERKTQIKINRQKVTKKKRSHKLKGSCNYNYNTLNANLENINEVLCVHKNKLAVGKGAWKVVPKDSCEVYKDRRKRQMNTDHNNENEELHEDNENRENMRNKNKPHMNKDKKIQKEPGRNKHLKRKSHRRLPRESSMSSCTTCSTRTTSTMYTSASEMEYD